LSAAPAASPLERDDNRHTPTRLSFKRRRLVGAVANADRVATSKSMDDDGAD
jgi:hypothetical protein